MHCKRGPSFHGGHERRDPNCVLYGCESSNLKELGSYMRSKKIQAEVQKALSTGELTSSSKPTTTTPKTAMPTPLSGVTPLPKPAGAPRNMPEVFEG